MKPRHCGILLALGTLAHAWRATFSDATQCGNVTVSWAGLGGEKIGPPFVARLAAPGLAPLVINIPTSAWSATAQAGNYSFTVPWPAGTKYVTSMDDGFGSGTGGVTGVQTVQSSSKADCITSDITQPKHVFDLFGTFIQCSVVSMNWTEPATANTLITGLVPNGVAFALDPPVANSKSTTWNLNIPTGTGFVLMYNSYPGPNLTSPLLISGGDGATQTCLSSGSYPSATAPQAGIAEATSTIQPSTSASATSRTKSTPNVGAIVGATLGAVAFLTVAGFAICLCLRRRRFRPVQPPSPGIDKDMNLESVNTYLDNSYRHPMVHQNNLPEGAVVLPFVLPNASSSTPGYSIRKGQQPSVRADSGGEPSRNTYESTESSHLTARTSSSGTHHEGAEYDNEPVFIRHEDAGRVPMPRVREVIELPPGYDQLSRPLPPTQQAGNQTQRQTEDDQVRRKPGPSR